MTNETTTIEVAHEEGGWKISRISIYDVMRGGMMMHEKEVVILSHRRRKAHAVLVGTGAAAALRCELKVHKKRDGQYGKDGASFGHDPRGNG